MPRRMKLLPPVILALLMAVVMATAQTPSQSPQPPAKQFRPTDPLPVDPNVRLGKLDNGLTYYIRRNTEPAKRAELRLVVNAGSVLEEDDQRGLAHFLEHMLFNGTRRFKGPELINFLERTGMEFGPDVNAYTSFDETVYMLKIPTDKPEIIKTSFEVLEDWAAYATLDPKEIDEERGIIVEEWRLRDKNAGGRIRDKALPVLLGGSRYVERLPIGNMDVVRNAPPEAFQRFYKTWYRPDLMAVVAVGDFDVNQIEALIRQHFATLPKPETPKPRPAYSVPDRQETRYLVISDPEMPYTSLQISWKRDAHEDKTVADYRESLARNLFNDMLNNRFAEIARKPDSPFIFAAASSSDLVRTAELYTI
ncbi:MAG TPA: pitrilysin family protein, partial [Blastocatellia bacterium]|nr:pitrilysin family protein [Blastocatellia bacterium]